MTVTETPVRQKAPRPALRTEVRRGVGPWTGLSTALTLGVTMAAKADQWQGDWIETQSLLHSGATLLVCPLVAATACWQGARDHRRSTGELWRSTPRARWQRMAVAALPLALWAVAGYVVALAGSSAATWPYAGGGGPLLSLVVVDAAALAAMALFGFAVGVLCRWRLAAPVLAVLMYLVLGVPNYSETSTQYLDPAVQYVLWDRLPVWWFAPAMAAWTGGLAVAALTAVAARRRLAALVPLAVAAAVAPLIVSTGDGMFRDDPAAHRIACTEGSPQICLSGRQEHLLPQVTEALSGLTGRLEGLPGAPKRYVDRPPAQHAGEARMPTPNAGWYLLRGRLQHKEDFAWQVATQLLARDCPVHGAGSKSWNRVIGTDSAVSGWLIGSHTAQMTYVSDSPELRRLDAMPDAERRAWLGRYMSARNSCDASEVPVL
ncbi:MULTISPECIES: hypothetical protein [unclassified Streptomyces]|uniref:hypothetical protein n=1 Tax=unclassified Streptomyces TaxID=2593676 RepID=UPI002ED141BA|nr:hypothetical protein OH827_23345 [Streptomyces sp. NBC_00891]WSY07763.1 hypothetical protein OG464_23345 [Streptomyces sp. NBC_00890]WSZ09389.1 hypothetical protein OG704_23350 [Streptomyces sp. NBC_00869]WSZ23112.1 hypothetical protein OG498_10220 [Streptomyces sp. NBC_00870]